MDLVNYDENIYNSICEEFKIFYSKLNINDIRFIPISALHGDNVVNKSEKMHWFKGSTLLHELNLEVQSLCFWILITKIDRQEV